MKSNIILGLNINHADSAACIIKNNNLEFAIEEEKLNRKKHWAGIPINAIKECIKCSDIRADDISDICINTNPFSNLNKKISFFLKNYLFGNKKFEIFKRISKKINIKNILIKEIGLPKHIKINYIDHHLSHVASSFYPSGFCDATCISVDGFGDFVSTVIAECNEKKIKILDKIYFPNSLGVFYEAMTQFLNFKNYGDEYKLMGLSSYGKPIHSQIIKKLFLKNESFFELNQNYFQYTKKNFEYKFEGIPQQNILYSKEIYNLFKNINIEREKANIAASIQFVYEEIFFNILKYARSISNSKNLCLSGGCALNSVANGKISKNFGFENIYIPYAPGDAGGAIGSSIICSINKYNSIPINLNNPFIGPKFTENNIELEIINLKLDKYFIIKKLTYENIYIEVSKLILQSKIIGWFQDNIEFGQRALGNRSILGDPRNKNIREIINTKIKKRELFRPFAPSIIHNYKNDWFNFSLSRNNFMETVIKVREEKKHIIPSVVHVDGTCRVQVVEENTNKKFYNLIKTFNYFSNVPILLNTSFNENEPIVCTPRDAIECFLRTKMDAICLQNFLILRK